MCARMLSSSREMSVSVAGDARCPVPGAGAEGDSGFLRFWDMFRLYGPKLQGSGEHLFAK